jgi:hypothetical protein
MSFNNTTGAITGMPVQLDTIVIATEATNAAGTGTGSTTVIILPGTQVITFDPLTPVTYGDAPFTLSATGGASGNPITFTSSDFNVATISGNTVTIVGAGTCTVTASQAGNTEYNAAADVSQSLLVNKAAQTITFGPLVTRVTTDPPFALSATGGASGNPVTYTSSNTSVATIAGNIVTIVGAGTTMITASQAGDANYLPATDVSQNQLINQAGLLPQVITFNPLPAVPYGSSTITLTATGGGSGNPITYTSSNTNVATISGNVMTILAPGTTTITASQSGNASYLDAVDESQVQLVNPAELTITGALAFNKVYDGTTNAVLFNLNLNGIIGSDLVTVSGGGTFASPNVGTAIPVTGNLILGGADSFKYTLVQPTGLSADITPASQTIVFNPIPAKTFGNAPFALSATGGGSVSPIVFTSDNPLVATIVGDSVFIIGSGTTNITASQAADANHDAAVDVTQVLTVNPANQFITFPTIPSQVVGAAPFVLNATSTSGLAITYTSSNPLVATISGDSVTIVGLGTTTITASQAGNTNYNPANNVNRVLNVTYPIIAAWDFFGVSSPATFAATTFDPQLVSSGGLNLVTRGPGAAANTATNSFRSTGFQNNGIAVTNTDYFQTTLKATPGHSLSVSSILANFAGTASFAASPGVTSQFAYSLDGTTFNLISTAFVTVATPAQSPIIDLTSIAELQNLHESKTVTFRYYASGQTATGGWGFNSPSAGVNGLAFGGDVVVCVPQTNTTSLTICNTQLPYTWGTQTLTASGTYTNTAINVAGCDSIEILNLTVNNCSNSELNLKLFIEAYWNGAGGMVPALANQGEISTATACDSITVQLRDSLTPSTIIQSVKVVLNQDGTATCSFPSVNGSYYIAVIHRNAIETWSANPVAISSTPVTYDFTTNLNKAFGDNQVEVATGVWAFYSGDIVKDFAESIDLIDLGQVEDEINNFSFGYFAEDLNGDGNVDILDTPNLESNINSFIFSNHP